MALGPEKQDANLVGFYKIREATLGQVPATGSWQTREPNSFDDLGAEYTKVARRPFSPSRQRKKGSTTDMDADGGYNEDLTQNNMQGELEEFFFAELRSNAELKTAAPVSLLFTVNATTDVATVAGGHGLENGAGPFQVSAATALPDGLLPATDYWAIVTGTTTFKFATSLSNALAATAVDIIDTGTGALTMTSSAQVSGTDDSFTINSVPDSVFTGTILLAKGYSSSANNGLKDVVSTTASEIIVAQALENEAQPPVGASLKVVGHTFAASDVELEVQESSPGVTSGFRLVVTAGSFLEYNLVPGSWIYIGGDDAGSFFEDSGSLRMGGYARIALDGVSSDGKTVTFDKATFTPEDDAGTGVSLKVYFSDVIKNEDDPDLIVRFSSVMERTLGKDADGTQSEYLTGSVASEMTWNSPLANLVNFDMSYICQTAGLRKGIDGPLARRVDNTVVRALGEDAFNTTSNVYRLRMSAIDPDLMSPSPFFARVTEWTATINNNISSAKAQGVLGGFDTTVGNFDVDAEVTAYFSSVEVIHAVKCNWDVTFDAIYAKANAGVYLDLPLVSLGGGRLDIEQDAAIMVPLQSAAAESAFGHTALVGWFSYLPNAAMPDLDC